MFEQAASLEDKYRVERGRIFLTGVQALVRLLMMQRERDRAAGLNTAGYVSGYRGSPLGGLDTELHEAGAHLAAHDVRFRPAVNEDLAATAIWGTQQLHLFPGAKRDGIFAMWYGKGPGVDRCGDVFKHANHAGTAPAGGVLVVAGDDHAARSSAVAHQSEHMFSACAMPVLAPCSVQEILDLGLHGWAMSRYTGCWVALKLAADVVESSATVEIDPARVRLRVPSDFVIPPEGVHMRWPDPQHAQELRMQAVKIYAASAYARANALDRIVIDSPRPRLGLIACGKAWLDLRQALAELGIDDERAARLGLRIGKVAMPWPLEAEGARRFATGLEEILVIEEKRQIIEYQLKEMLYNWRDDVRPRVIGKFDQSGEWPAPQGRWLLPPTGELSPRLVARALASRLAHFDPAGDWASRAQALTESAAPPTANLPTRSPYFCSGCPHNRSTQVPEGSCALAGVGCHLMAVGMERRTLTISQMGGEGATWIGLAEHSGVRHVFANMGDGTYFHSGLLAIRAAVAAGVPITYKLLYNDAVAMTGGQHVDGPLTVPQLTRQVRAEGVERIVVLTDDATKYRRDAGFAAGVQVLPRERLEPVQRELREYRGVSVLVYDQTCATEARRRRRRGNLPAPTRHVFIHEAVCEGCGDCSVKSNCLAIVPVATEFGTKRAIDAFTCNQDLSCLEGECPAMVSVEGRLKPSRPREPADDELLSEPVLPPLAMPWSMLVAGVGGSGVVTIGALLGMAAHLEGKAATVLDQTGMAQKGGAVLTHVRIAPAAEALHAPRIVKADLLLGCELLVAAGGDVLSRLRQEATQAVVNSAKFPTGDWVRHPDRELPHAQALAQIRAALAAPDELDATHLASVLVGHPIAANMLLLGYAWQRGWVPLARDSLLRAVQLNGVAVEENRLAFAWGRRAALDLRAVQQHADAIDDSRSAQRLSATLTEAIARRRGDLSSHHGEALARRYEALVDAVRRAEQRAVPGSERLGQAVARQAHRLFAVKDAYEVARLYSDPAFDAALGRRFEGPWRLHFHMAVPWSGGAARKRRWGPGLRPLLRLLALGRHIRGSWLDPLRGREERRLERLLADDYEAAIRRIIGEMRPDQLDAAVAIAELPESVRGFGGVKRQRLIAARERLALGLAAAHA